MIVRHIILLLRLLRLHRLRATVRVDRPPARTRAARLALMFIFIYELGHSGWRFRRLVEEDLIGGVEQVLVLIIILMPIHRDVKA